MLRLLQFWAKNRARWSSNAHSVKQYAMCIRDRLADDYNLTSLQLYFDIWCSLNGRFQQRYDRPRRTPIAIQQHVQSRK